ncbi:MAG: hypothetical protein IJP71_00160 [Lachnospiraceae bacterium]|nr:hypothetical protein [Lachnospiraceae bacterium]
MYRVVDDSDEDYLYDKTNPKPTDDRSKGGKWEVVETISCKELDRKLKYVSNIDFYNKYCIILIIELAPSARVQP